MVIKSLTVNIQIRPDHKEQDLKVASKAYEEAMEYVAFTKVTESVHVEAKGVSESNFIIFIDDKEDDYLVKVSLDHFTTYLEYQLPAEFNGKLQNEVLFYENIHRNGDSSDVTLVRHNDPNETEGYYVGRRIFK